MTIANSKFHITNVNLWWKDVNYLKWKLLTAGILRKLLSLLYPSSCSSKPSVTLSSKIIESVDASSWFSISTLKITCTLILISFINETYKLLYSKNSNCLLQPQHPLVLYLLYEKHVFWEFLWEFWRLTQVQNTLYMKMLDSFCPWCCKQLL